MRLNFFLKSLITNILILSFLTGCKSENSNDKKKILRLNFYKTPPTLDPRKGSDPVASTFHFMLFDGLTGLTKESSSTLILADSYENSLDFKTYTFHLKKAKWSNGEPITAYDFEKSWKEMLSPNFPCPNAHLLFPIKNAEHAKNGLVPLSEIKITAIDQSTLVIELEHPTPHFLELTSFCVLFPVSYSDKQKCPYNFDAPNPDFPVSGAFKIKSWTPGYEMILEKNPYYHLSDKVNIDEIKISFVADENTAFNLFQNKEIDILGGFFGDIPFEEASILKENKKLNTVSIGSTTFCSFNLNKFPFNNKKIRKAIELSIDKQDLVNNILQFDEIQASGFIPPFMKNQKSEIKNSYYEKETALNYLNIGLKEIGLTIDNLPELYLTFSNSDLNKRIATAIQNQLENNLNIKIHLEPLELKIYLDKLNSKNYSFALCMSVIQYNDIMNFLERFRRKSNPKNFPGFEDENFINCLNLSGSSNQFETRLKYFTKAEKLLLDSSSIITLYHSNFVYIQQAKIKNFYVSPIGSMHVNFIDLD